MAWGIVKIEACQGFFCKAMQRCPVLELDAFWLIVLFLLQLPGGAFLSGQWFASIGPERKRTVARCMGESEEEEKEHAIDGGDAGRRWKVNGHFVFDTCGNFVHSRLSRPCRVVDALYHKQFFFFFL